MKKIVYRKDTGEVLGIANSEGFSINGRKVYDRDDDGNQRLRFAMNEDVGIDSINIADEDVTEDIKNHKFKAKIKNGKIEKVRAYEIWCWKETILDWVDLMGVEMNSEEQVAFAEWKGRIDQSVQSLSSIVEKISDVVSTHEASIIKMEFKLKLISTAYGLVGGAIPVVIMLGIYFIKEMK